MQSQSTQAASGRGGCPRSVVCSVRCWHSLGFKPRRSPLSATLCGSTPRRGELPQRLPQPAPAIPEETDYPKVRSAKPKSLTGRAAGKWTRSGRDR
ncbi:hypothetical protein P154DRAFT_304408 [Amniculicola lignicola CBS 123094]|uniref:Uncharacterized protein n=1 Tax=Amniculicola lignicola CBS 123094 TaxID=1392246 RepID=A0A6A5W7J1_9PLEO|nr:hypothetical protein P154DRAFT_304408 [Amniculicola lignicola CBS 123094]